MIWEHWLIAISIAIVAIAFVVLVVYVILALLSMRKVVDDLDEKVRALDPIFRVVSKAGNAIEKKATHIQQLTEEFEHPVRAVRDTKRQTAVDTAIEVTEWALIGLALWQKIKERK